MIDSRAIGGAVVKKSIVINSSQNWTAPANLAGNTAWITASGAGGGGVPWDPTGFTRGACGGNYCVKVPVIVAPSSTTLVTIGAGGTAGAVGGSTSFGSLITLAGGSPSVTAPNPVGFITSISLYSMSGVKAAVFARVDTGSSEISFVSSAPESAGGFTGLGIDTSSGTYYYSGPACGYFGNPNLSAAGTANTGAGGGANSLGGFAGGSGKMIIEWEEFL
jgi:hypothetical protein